MPGQFSNAKLDSLAISPFGFLRCLFPLILKIIKDGLTTVCEKKPEKVTLPVEKKIEDEDVDLFIEGLNMYREYIFEKEDQYVVNYEWKCRTQMAFYRYDSE